MNQRMTITLFVVLTASLLEGMPRNSSKILSWPKIKPLNKIIMISDLNHDLGLAMIKGVHNTPKYVIWCASGYSGIMLMNNELSAPIECQLYALYASSEASQNLFDPNPYPDSLDDSRARFFPNQLLGKCGNYPQWGKSRYFSLRGMKIHIIVSPIWSNFQHMTGARIHIIVNPDNNVLSWIAEPSHINAPNVNCNNNQKIISNYKKHRKEYPFILKNTKLMRITLPMPGDKVSSTITEHGHWHMKNGALPLFFLNIYGYNNIVEYELKCFSTYYNARDQYYKLIPGIGCGLYPPNSKFDYLSTGTDPVSEMNPQIITSNTFDGCNSYPVWGATRTYKLRHMKITLHFTDVIFRNRIDLLTSRRDVIKNLVVSAKAEYDNMANNRYLKPPKIIPWRIVTSELGCDTIWML